MKRMMIVSIAVAGLLLCTGNVQAQSRVVRQARTETRERDDRYVDRSRNDNTRERRHDVAVPVTRGPKLVKNDVITAIGRERYDNDRLRMAEMVFKTDGVMNMAQVLKVAGMFSYESNRVTFLTKAYDYCVDRYDYYKVLETLNYNSSREKIIDMIIRNGGLRDKAVGLPTQSEMKTIIRMLEDQTYETTRTKVARMFLASYDFTTRQIADMAMIFNYETNKVNFLKEAYECCVDPYNYYLVLETLSYNSNRETIIEMMTYKTGVRNKAQGVPSKNEMNAIVRTLNDQNYETTRMKLGRMFLKTDNFTARQIAEMANTLNYESNRTDFLADAIDSCVDIDNYLIAINTLSYSSNRRKIEDMIVNRRRR